MANRTSAVIAIVVVASSILAAQSGRDHALLPVVGTWEAGHEGGRSTITIQGSASPAAVHASAAKTLFGSHAEALLASVGAAPAFPLAVSRDLPDFRGGTLAVEFKLLKGTDDRSGGIVFNLKPDGSYNFARYNTKDGNVAIWKFENGKRTVLAHGEEHEQLPTGTWNTLKVTIAGTAVVATVNDKLRVRHALDQPVAGRVGLWAKSDVVTAFRGFTAESR